METDSGYCYRKNIVCLTNVFEVACNPVQKQHKIKLKIRCQSGLERGGHCFVQTSLCSVLAKNLPFLTNTCISNLNQLLVKKKQFFLHMFMMQINEINFSCKADWNCCHFYQYWKIPSYTTLVRCLSWRDPCWQNAISSVLSHFWTKHFYVVFVDYSAIF